MPFSSKRHEISFPLHVWAEFVMGLLNGVALTVTLVWPRWIELVCGVDPDGGSGASERLIAVGLVAITFAFMSLAGRGWWKALRRQEA